MGPQSAKPVTPAMPQSTGVIGRQMTRPASAVQRLAGNAFGLQRGPFRRCPQPPKPRALSKAIHQLLGHQLAVSEASSHHVRIAENRRLAACGSRALKSVYDAPRRGGIALLMRLVRVEGSRGVIRAILFRESHSTPTVPLLLIRVRHSWRG